MSGSPKTTNRLPLPVFFSSPAMCRSGFILAFRIGSGAELGQLGGVRVEGEGAGDQHVEARLGRLARGGDEIDAGERAELRADQDGGAALSAVLALHEDAFGADVLARPAGDGDRSLMRSPFVALLHAGGAQVLEHHRRRSRSAAAASLARRLLLRRASELVGQLVVAGGHDAVRRQAFDRERPGDADAAVVLVGPVVEVFDVGGLGDRGVDLLLPRDARFPPCGVGLLGGVGPIGLGLARDLPFLPGLARAPC